MKITMRRILFLILLLGPGLAIVTPARAQSAVQVIELPVEYTYADHILFKVQVVSTTPIDSVTVIFAGQDETALHSGQAEIGPGGIAAYRFDAARESLTPFGLIRYQFQIALQDGQRAATRERSFRYIDNRFQWQGLEDAILHVYWYTGDADFGQNAFDVAHLGLQKFADLLQVPQSGPIDIYVYASAADMQNALGPAAQAWAAGHANPASGVAMVSIPAGPEQNLEMERQIPHELAHILLFRAMGDSYHRLPTWLNEGIASSAELFPNLDYMQTLNLAVRDRRLIPMAELCTPFPPDAARAFLAYAESQSFTAYLYGRYGISGVTNLIGAYANGLDCENAVAQGLGQPLADLERDWRRTALGENPLLTGLENTGPYLILLVLVLLVPVWRVSTAGAVRKPAAQTGSHESKPG